ncbi:hypothetical protein ANN_09250 [Periplaneta americana]|uniref:Uncharacterized protein n=1 Tax=Periplaneta americana TaxID=6978 RepID=A0ABQ8TMA5_PERAM|nr:hypothetical protein ANN_09250 [Periplaneta americana]
MIRFRSVFKDAAIESHIYIRTSISRFTVGNDHDSGPQLRALCRHQALPARQGKVVTGQLSVQHDGAPPHFSLAVREHLDRRFEQRWIGRGGPIVWPPLSPDLTPLNFFLWGLMKSLVYEAPVETAEDLVARVVVAAGEIADTPGVIERV